MDVACRYFILFRFDYIGANGNFMNMFAGHSGPSTCGCFTSDGNRIVSFGSYSMKVNRSFQVQKTAQFEYSIPKRLKQYYISKAMTFIVKELTLWMLKTTFWSQEGKTRWPSYPIFTREKF